MFPSPSSLSIDQSIDRSIDRMIHLLIHSSILLVAHTYYVHAYIHSRFLQIIVNSNHLGKNRRLNTKENNATNKEHYKIKSCRRGQRRRRRRRRRRRQDFLNSSGKMDSARKKRETRKYSKIESGRSIHPRCSPDTVGTYI